jgi:hypothetical protein
MKEMIVRAVIFEGRFQSLALFDEGALLACVSLNPIRTCMVGTLEESDFTLIQACIKT